MRCLVKPKRLSKAGTRPIRSLPSNGISRKAGGYSSKVIAEISREGEDFSVRYIHEVFNRVYQFDNQILSASLSSKQLTKFIRRSLPRADEASGPGLLSVLHKLRRISSRNLLTHRILEGVIEHQKEYLKTGNPIDLAPLSQVRLAGSLSAHCSMPGAGGADGRGLLAVSVDISWVSRLVNKLSVITPFGEEKPLRWFFQTRRDVNKRLVKQLIDKESADLESGKLKKPYTDNELKEKLKSLLQEKYFGRPACSVEQPADCKNLSPDTCPPSADTLSADKISRWTVGHCRKDMGIPPAKRRLSGYKYPPLSANFSMLYPLVIEEVIRNTPAGSGVYEFRLKGKEVEYPHGKTPVIYIGSTKNIRKRLREHLGKNSKNEQIRGFVKKHECSFRYVQFSKGWQREEKRFYALFMGTYGSGPKCNRVRP